MPTLHSNIAKLHAFKKLDSTVASFGTDFLASIECILKELPYQPEIFPTYQGTVQLEYEKTSGKYLEIEITPENAMSIFKISDTGEETEENYEKSDIKKIVKEVCTFYG